MENIMYKYHIGKDLNLLLGLTDWLSDFSNLHNWFENLSI